MIRDLSLTIIKEGGTRLIVPADTSASGPATSSMPVFYNPQMEFNRDMTVAVLANLLPKGSSVLDGLSATGAMGIRVYSECGKEINLTLNDGKRIAMELIERNLLLNGIKGPRVLNRDLRELLRDERHDHVDIDPFGSPAPFLPMAIEAVEDGGTLSVTATDTGTISGIFTGACLRRYGISARRTTFCHELGVRNLLGFVARHAAENDIGIEPQLSFYADHYVRCFIRISKGAAKAEEALRNIGYCDFNEQTLDRTYSKDKRGASIGPTWIAQTCKIGLLDILRMPTHLGNAHRVAKYFDLLRGEAHINRPFFLVDELSRKFRCDPPKMDVFLGHLSESGQAYRTHHDPRGIVTDLEIGEIVEIMRECGRPNC